MALSKISGEVNLTAERLETTADVSRVKLEDGFSISSIKLTIKGKVPGGSQKTFLDLATKAKGGCPVLKLFKTEITLDASVL